MDRLLDYYVHNYILLETKNHNFILMKKTSFRLGKFYGTRGGDGVVVVNESYTDKEGNHVSLENRYVVDKGSTNGAIDGDIVFIDTYTRDYKGTLSGKVVSVVERNLNNIVGEVYKIGNSSYVRPVDKRKQNLIIKVPDDAIEGMKVSVSLKQQTSDNFYIGYITRVFEHKDDPKADILWEAFKCGLVDGFSDESEVQAKNIPSSVLDRERIGRVDLTKLRTFTIDGADTKDIDDALSYCVLPNGNRVVIVSIADVSHYVPEGSPIDKDAFQKGCSWYLAGTVSPMLPRKLSNDICSLRANVDRLALSCAIEYDKSGNKVSSTLFPSVIRSDKQMSYDKVNSILKDGVVPNGYEEYEDDLRVLAQLMTQRRKKRLHKGAIEFERPEMKVELDETGFPIKLSTRVQDIAENLIEEYMLDANESVDEMLEDNQIPNVHRIHDTPNLEKLEEYLQFIDTLGIDFHHSAEECCTNPKYIQELSELVKNQGGLSDLLSVGLVRCMSRAKYSPNNIGHYGLAKKNYCHFTSPIRRYSDLTTHRIIKDCYFKKSLANCQKWRDKLPEICLHVSKRERDEDDAEKEVMYMKTAEYMTKHIGEDYVGTITGVSNHGLQIQLENLIEGRVRPRILRGDYEYVPESYSYVSLDGFEDYYLGDQLSVKVSDANKENKLISFSVNQKLKEYKVQNADIYNQHIKVKSREMRRK